MSETLHDWLCRRIVDHSGSAILFADREGFIRLWNHGAEEMFGYPPYEALGQPLDIIIPDRWRERHRAGYEAAMASGRTRYTRDVLAVPARRKDGTRISIEFSIILLRDDQDVVVGAAAIVKDVTQRWERDKALKQRLAFLEAGRERGDTLSFRNAAFQGATAGVSPARWRKLGNGVADRDFPSPGRSGPSAGPLPPAGCRRPLRRGLHGVARCGAAGRHRPRQTRRRATHPGARRGRMPRSHDVLGQRSPEEAACLPGPRGGDKQRLRGLIPPRELDPSRVEPLVVAGPSHQAIRRAASEVRPDLVVMNVPPGSAASASRAILRRATCPVLLTPAPEAAARVNTPAFSDAMHGARWMEPSPGGLVHQERA